MESRQEEDGAAAGQRAEPAQHWLRMSPCVIAGRYMRTSFVPVLVGRCLYLWLRLCAQYTCDFRPVAVNVLWR